jgi:hypothetical protein
MQLAARCEGAVSTELVEKISRRHILRVLETTGGVGCSSRRTARRQGFGGLFVA